MTGDIVQYGLSGEIALGAEWLGRLGGPEQVSFSPGNHDAMSTGHGVLTRLSRPEPATTARSAFPICEGGASD